MVEKDLGEATIVYEDPDDGTVEKQVENEHVAYFQDHWIIKTGEHEEGHDIVRRIPAQRVYYVERSVEEFESEIRTLRDQVQSFTDEIRTKILGGEKGESGGEQVHRIEVESGEPVDDENDESDQSENA